jgi:hypothetical protein
LEAVGSANDGGVGVPDSPLFVTVCTVPLATIVEPPYACVFDGGTYPPNGKFQVEPATQATGLATHFQTKPPSKVELPYTVPQGLNTMVAVAVSETPVAFRATMVFEFADCTENDPLFDAFVKPLIVIWSPAEGVCDQEPAPNVYVVVTPTALAAETLTEVAMAVPGTNDPLRFDPVDDTQT